MWFFKKNNDNENQNENEDNQDNENDEDNELNNIRNSILNEEDINSKLKLYFDLFDCISSHTKKRKEGLNLYYSRLNSIHFFVNVSIISLSAASTFIQSLVPNFDDYEVFRIILLSITTYSGLTLAISKFYKLDEKKENTNSLRDRFTELQTKVKFHIDSLAPWKYGIHYKNKSNKKNKNSKETEWISLVGKIESEYMNIIDCKRELNSNYEKLLEKGTTKTYISKYKDKKKISKKAQSYENEIDNIKLDNDKLRKYIKEKKIQYELESWKKEIEWRNNHFYETEKSIFNEEEDNEENKPEKIPDNFSDYGIKKPNISDDIIDNQDDDIPKDLKPDNP